MQITVFKENDRGETRVALVPATIRRLVAKGFQITIEPSAGEKSFIEDAEYAAAGATVESRSDALYAKTDLVLQIQRLTAIQLNKLREGSMLISALEPHSNLELVQMLAAKRITALAVDMIPRSTLSQTMDVLSSQTTISGYHGALLAAAALPKLFPMLMTAAGTIAPAKVLVLGAGVCGLQAIATARRLGAVVEAYDVRRAVKEQVHSLGAKFVEVQGISDAETRSGYAREITNDEKQRQVETLRQHVAKADVCITSALVPGRRAPILVTREMVHGMRRGSVIVDLAAEQGGNCELCRPGETVVERGVSIIGPTQLPAKHALDASQMYSRNMEKLVLHLTREAALHLDFADEIVAGCTITHAGRVVHPEVSDALVQRGAA